MDKKSIIAIEKIITYITELKIITRGKDDNYFFSGYETPILCDLVDKIDINITKINLKIKNKYNNINWNIIDSKKYGEYGEKKLKLGEVWNLASSVLEKELLESLNKILVEELPMYYKNYCDNKHKKFIKEKTKNI